MDSVSAVKPRIQKNKASSTQFKRLVASSLIGSALPFLVMNPNPVLASPLDAANKAMRQESERNWGEERDLKALPSAAKKRRAIAGCKDPNMRKIAGYMSASKCTQDAVDGDYDQMIKALSGDIDAPPAKSKKGRR